jgi:hypothetical protein
MTDVSGIPNMGFGGGGYFGGIPNVAPAWDANQINRSMGMGPGGAGTQDQNTLNNIFSNFGRQTDYYSGLGAAYGRQTGGFGGAAGRVGTISNPGTSYNPYVPTQNPFANAARVRIPTGGGPSFDTGGHVDPTPDVGAGSGGGPAPDMTEYLRGFGLGRGGGGAPPMVQSSPTSPFSGMGFGGNRDFLAALMRNNASPTPPALHSQNPGAANDFLQRYQQQGPQSQIDNRFGGFQQPEWSAPGITLGDQLRQQGGFRMDQQ